MTMGRSGSRKWTPGPWMLDHSEESVFSDVTGANIAEWVHSNRVSEQERRANMRLIAAAPDMAEALERIAVAKTAVTIGAMVPVDLAKWQGLHDALYDAIDTARPLLARILPPDKPEE